MINDLLYSIKLNKEYLEKPNAVWIITAANNKTVLDGISKGLCRIDDAVVLGGILCPDNILSPFGAVLAYLTGSMIVCNDIITDPKVIFNTYKTINTDLPNGISDDFVSLDLHINMHNIEQVSSDIGEDIEETIALTLSYNKQLPLHLQEMFIKPNVSVEEIEKIIHENYNCLKYLWDMQQ